MDWAHSPLHRTEGAGWYFVTAGTYLRKHFLAEEQRRADLVSLLESTAVDFKIDLQAWVVLANHYHLIVLCGPDVLRPFIQKLHSLNARDLNSRDGAAGRRVWYQYWEKHLTYEHSYLARLNYIHQNPVHHGLVTRAELYRWSSLRWFEETADRAFANAVRKFKTDRLNVLDDF